MQETVADFSNWTVWATFIVYLVAVFVIGVVAWRRTSDIGDYILGGRRLGGVVAALSAGASDMSGWLLLGLPGLAYAAFGDALWLAGGLLCGTWLNWRLVARPLREATERYGNALTIPEYLERRFSSLGVWLRAVSAIFILFFFTIYTASGLVAGGKLFVTVFGLPYHQALLAGCLTIAAYTLLGGFLAVSWTDAFQALLMSMALVVVPVMAIVEGDGSTGALLQVAVGGTSGAVAVISLVAWGLGYFGQPHILARFMAIEEPSRTVTARRIAVTWAAIGMGGAIFVGLAGRALIGPEMGDPERVFMELVGRLLHPLPAGICLAGILAAVMSTADSQLLVSSSALTEDFYRRVLRPKARQEELILVGRLAVVLVGLVALALAWSPGSQVLDLVGYAWAGFGAGFGPVIVSSLWLRWMSGAGALAGIVAGSLTVIVWRHLSGGIFDLYELVPGAIAALIAILAVSRLCPECGEDGRPEGHGRQSGRTQE